MSGEATIIDMVNAKRADVPDAAFERLINEVWYCPHCRVGRTIMDTAIELGAPGSGFACRVCDKKGIIPARGDAHIKFRQMLTMLAPYNRSGSA